MLVTGGSTGIDLATAQHLLAERATKAGLRLLARTWSTELRERGSRVNVVSPGLFLTGAYATPGLAEAAVVLFAASDDSSYMTGAELIVDGGLTQV